MSPTNQDGFQNRGKVYSSCLPRNKHHKSPQNICLHLIVFLDYAPINVKPAGGGGGIGRGFDIFQNIGVKFPTPGQKCDVKYN